MGKEILTFGDIGLKKKIYRYENFFKTCGYCKTISVYQNLLWIN